MPGDGEGRVLDLISSFLSETSNRENDKKMEEPSREASGPSITTATTSPTFRVIVFSKDRPWQLKELLQSCACKDEDDFEVIVIVHCSSRAFADGYRNIPQFPKVQFWWECKDDESDKNSDDDKDDTSFCRFESNEFASLLERATTADGKHQKDGLVMFLTDDCILLEPLRDVQRLASTVLQSMPTVLGFYTRLHPGISWSQTRSQKSPPPTSFSAEFGPDLLIYRRTEGEWNYPFDLSGGVYRRTLVQKLLESTLRSPSYYNHPNTLEVEANRRGSFEDTPLAAISSKPLLYILALNRVQTVFHAPLAIENQKDGELYSPKALLDWIPQQKTLDLQKYRHTYFPSSHIGHVFLQDVGSETSRSGALEREKVSTTKEKFALSVLMPVHRGPPSVGAHAMASIVSQPFEVEMQEDDEHPLSPLQIVVVDDRSEDGTVDAMVAVTRDIVTSNDATMNPVRLLVRDHRHGASRGEEEEETNFSGNVTLRVIKIVLDLVSSDKPGVAAALNAGLPWCRSGWIARMDADDVCCPGRLLAQVKAMQHKPAHVAVLGMGMLLFANRTSNDSDDNDSFPAHLPYSSSVQHYQNGSKEPPLRILRPSIPPCEGGFVAWTLFFSCTVCHPTVMFRAEALRNVGGYSQEWNHAEDYDLWLRLTQQATSGVVDCCTNIPRIGLWHRKGSLQTKLDTPPKTKQQEQRREADEIAKRAMEQLLCRSLKLSTVQSLRRPSRETDETSPLTLADLNEAARVLLQLETAFLKRHDSRLNARAVALIHHDCHGRLGELAMLAIQRHGRQSAIRDDSGAWQLWCQKCPELELERLALLCRAPL